MTNNAILYVLHSVFLYCKLNNIDVVLQEVPYTVHGTSQYNLGDLRIQDDFIVWKYTYSGYVNDIKIIEILKPITNLKELEIICFDCLSFQKSMDSEIHKIFNSNYL